MGFFKKLLNAITEPVPTENAKPVGLLSSDNKRLTSEKETKEELYKLIEYDTYPVEIARNKKATPAHIEDLFVQEGIATLHLETDNPVSSTAIAIYIDNTKVGYLPHEQNNIYTFLQLLQNKGINLTLKYLCDEVYIPTVSKTIELLKPELEEIFKELDELIQNDNTYNQVYDKEYYKFKNNLQDLAVKNKNFIKSYDFPITIGHFTKKEGTPGYFSVDGVLSYWAYALIVLLNAYGELKYDNEQYESNITTYESELKLQEQIKESYAELNTYAAVGRKFDINPQKIKKYIKEEIKQPPFKKYIDSDWNLLDLSSFDVLWQNRYMLEEWNSKWEIWNITIECLKYNTPLYELVKDCEEVNITGNDYFPHDLPTSVLLDDDAKALMVLEPNNNFSSTAIGVYINKHQIGYIPHYKTIYYPFLYLLQKQNIRLFVDKESDSSVYLPTQKELLNLLHEQIKIIFDKFDQFLSQKGDHIYDKLTEEGLRSTQESIIDFIYKNKEELTFYDFPVIVGPRTCDSKDSYYDADDGLLDEYAFALSLQLYTRKALFDTKVLNQQEKEKQKEIIKDYEQLKTYAAVSRKRNITTHMVKKYLNMDVDDIYPYAIEKEKLLNKSTFEIFSNYVYNDIKTPYDLYYNRHVIERTAKFLNF